MMGRLGVCDEGSEDESTVFKSLECAARFYCLRWVDRGWQVEVEKKK